MTSVPFPAIYAIHGNATPAEWRIYSLATKMLLYMRRTVPQSSQSQAATNKGGTDQVLHPDLQVRDAIGDLLYTLENAMNKSLLIVATSTVLFSASVFAEPTKMTSEMLDRVVAAGTEDPCPPPTPTAKGNNGWGNGADGTNPGSAAGPTSPSKLAGGNLATPPNKINTNPTTSSGR